MLCKKLRKEKQVFSTIEDLKSAPRKETMFLFDVGGHPLHAKFLPARYPTDSLIIAFHGAHQGTGTSIFDLTRNSVTLSNYAHQITVYDPAKLRREGFSISWYAGDDEFDTQALLPTFFQTAASALAVKRTVYFGSSGGGFAALFYSFHHTGSVAVSLAPQTNVHRHIPRAVERYFSSCWPDLAKGAIDKRISLDLGKLYRSRPFRNAVIMLMSAGDTFHYQNHAVPFLADVFASLAKSDISLTFASDYWGKLGHGGAIPSAGYLPWVRAALAAPSIDQEDILATYHAISSESQPVRQAVATGSAEKLTPSDLQMAKLLCEIELNRNGVEERLVK
jgi:hypothetical protein